MDDASIASIPANIMMIADDDDEADEADLCIITTLLAVLIDNNCNCDRGFFEMNDY